ncbi:hypothetical protein [uncultured Gammaproteobacteria bacterium]|uniref:Uncharacterized protein n=2 Tax=sulfur-oxidizing symbionts TaxID=32036 RepID=A0ACA8ZRF3_9GAMM|nr:hypothetical protein AZO1586R_1712 [Bathymodiolus azoricus thioautotrophic gill symbiont]CAB5505707.1 hypothetical protein AZO1586I_1498 [Bathymodiolus thermophilus thioautotrophic gill symbiont]CAC5821621.1 hypothetical protein [uncultured Gammaproteobacteria bacterium]CAC9432846.1 hypothetical protein [uncultured Gammaproteobacteria bacterium]CAC9485934.1 hypothetical protein [uncultured Gammaproteobacteria bacterium]
MEVTTEKLLTNHSSRPLMLQLNSSVVFSNTSNKHNKNTL